jgi:hypothetical protein
MVKVEFTLIPRLIMLTVVWFIVGFTLSAFRVLPGFIVWLVGVILCVIWATIAIVSKLTDKTSSRDI